MSSSHTKRLRARVSAEQNHRCCYCGVRTNEIDQHPESATLEHLVPRKLKGPTTYANCVMACQLCNSTRGTATAEHADSVAEDTMTIVEEWRTKIATTHRPVPGETYVTLKRNRLVLAVSDTHVVCRKKKVKHIDWYSWVELTRAKPDGTIRFLGSVSDALGLSNKMEWLEAA